MARYLLFIFITLLITSIILFYMKTNKKEPKIEEKTSMLNPHEFETGYIQDSPQQVADVCNSKMYPIDSIYVDYGFDDTNGDCKANTCDINIFNSTP